MNGENLALVVVCCLLVTQQLIHHFHIRSYEKQAETLAKLLAARNYTDYSVGEARQARANKPVEGGKGYEQAFMDGQ